MKKLNIINKLAATWAVAFLALWPIASECVIIEPLPDNKTYNYKITVTYSDLASEASATASNVVLKVFPGGTGTIPAGFTINHAAFALVTTFDTAGTDTTGITVGDYADADRLIVNKEIAGDATEVLYWSTANITDTLPYSFVVSTNSLSITVTNGNGILIDSFTQGEIAIFLGTERLQILKRD